MSSVADEADVVGVLTGHIERRFGMSVPSLRRAVSTRTLASPAAAEVVRWHGLLAVAQAALDRAEDALVAVLDTVPGDLAEDHDRIMLAANRVNDAVGIRDGRATVLAFLLDPGPSARSGPAAAWRGAVAAHRRDRPALATAAPAIPVKPPLPTGRGPR
ncbi:hypothetical protein ABZ714_11185 [Streptomyces sp. NPDC006798]|uniref:hypothetical protein n=1 Tax=Streptomyces sp. NPDC006798 TaxID=3155462 RepID=UPI0033F2DF97